MLLPHPRFRGASGPLDGAAWEPSDLPTPGGPLRLLTTTSVDGERTAILREPRLAATASGGPGVRLTVLLSREPTLGEPELSPLVVGGQLMLEVEVRPTAPETDALRPSARGLLPTRVRFTVGPAAADPWASLEAEGSSGYGGLAAALSREATLAVLAALRGHPGDSVVRAEVGYEAVATTPATVVRFDFRAVWDQLAQQGRAAFTKAELVEQLDRMLVGGVIVTEPPLGTGSAPLAERVLPKFLLIAPFLTSIDADPAGEVRWRLAPLACDGSISLRFAAETRSIPRALGIEAPLHELVRPVGSVLDSVLTLVSVGPEGIRPLVRRVPTNVARGADVAVLAPTRVGLVSVSSAIRPSAAPQSLLLTGVLMRPPSDSRLQVVALHDPVFPGVALIARFQHLPVVESLERPIWPDRSAPGRYWYLPSRELVLPDPTSTYENGPFQFKLRVVGHGADGRPTLEAELRLTLREGTSEATVEALRVTPHVQADPVESLATTLTLEIPYLDGANNPRWTSVTASSVERRGAETVASFRLGDAWARLAYGALAIDGFQRENARILVSTTFRGYSPATGAATHATLGQIRLEPPRFGGQRGVEAAGALAPAARFTPQLVLPVHPLLQAGSNAVRTHLAQQRVPVALPCGKYGALYVKEADGRLDPIGCEPAWSLAQSEAKAYARVRELPADVLEGVQVYQSLKTPGRFLVVPARYVIARFDGDHPDRPYRPAILLYGALDSADIALGRCTFMASVQPDVSPHQRLRLVECLRLAAYHPDPVLEWPTELGSSVEAAWGLPADQQLSFGVAAEWDTLQVGVTTTAARVLQLVEILKTVGLAASLAFRTPDGMPFASAISLSLRSIAGPWVGGPLSTESDGNAGTLRFTNRIERPVDLSRVLVDRGSGPLERIPANVSLGSGESWEGTAPPGWVDACPVTEVAPGQVTLDEVLTFVEDLQVSVTIACVLEFGAGLDAVEVEGDLWKDGPSRRVTLAGDMRVGNLDFVLPLTRYVSNPDLHLRVTLVGTQPRTVEKRWSLRDDGVVVTIDPDFVKV